MTFARIKPAGLQADRDTITAAEADTLDTSIADGLDIVGGDNVTPTADINIEDTNGGAFGRVVVLTQLRFKAGTAPRVTYKTGTIAADPDGQDIGIVKGQVLFFEDHTGIPQRDHDMDNTGATAGDFIRFIRDNTGANAIILWNDGHTGAIVTLNAGAARACTLYFDGSAWRLGTHSPGCTPGAAA
jgi:hypothetical protein